jgi:hypothetical protein
VKVLFMALSLLAVTPSPTPLDYESVFSQPVPIPWLVVTLGLVIFTLPFFLIIFFRRLSRLTRTGLYLLPWLPLIIACFLVYGHFHPEIFIDDGPWPWQHPVAARVAPFVGLGSMAAFLVGFILLVVAGVTSLARRRRRSA